MKTLLGLVTMVCLLLAQPLLAGFPGWYPKKGFPHYGEIDEVTPNAKAIIIEDMEYYYSDSTVVHSLSEESDSLGRLRKDVMVGFSYVTDGAGRKVIQEIWLLPSNYTQRDVDTE